jgi:hypothetical protein
MSFGNTSENDVLAFLFNATALPVAWPSSGGNFYIALHTADPGETGTGTTSEATYTGYARVAITRNSAGFKVSTNTISNTSTVTFGACTAGSSTITHWSLTSASTGSTQIFIKGALISPTSLAVSAGITPSFAAGALTATLD